MSGPTWIEVHLPDLFKRIPYPTLAMRGSINARRWEARIRKALRRIDDRAVFSGNGEGWIITSFNGTTTAPPPWLYGRIERATYSKEMAADLRTFHGVEPEIEPDGWHRRFTEEETYALARRGRAKSTGRRRRPA